jgi:hypothetical protein
MPAGDSQAGMVAPNAFLSDSGSAYFYLRGGRAPAGAFPSMAAVQRQKCQALLGGSDDSAVAIHVPVTELGNFLRMNQCCFAIYQILESDANAAGNAGDGAAVVC